MRGICCGFVWVAIGFCGCALEGVLACYDVVGCWLVGVLGVEAKNPHE